MPSSPKLSVRFMHCRVSQRCCTPRVRYADFCSHRQRTNGAWDLRLPLCVDISNVKRKGCASTTPRSGTICIKNGPTMTYKSFSIDTSVEKRTIGNQHLKCGTAYSGSTATALSTGRNRYILPAMSNIAPSTWTPGLQQCTKAALWERLLR